MRTDNRDQPANWWLHDLLASLVVFLVALPLCMGIAIACGMPPATGLISGVVGGIIVGALAGSPLQVSGPAAGLIVVVVEELSPFRNESGGLDLSRAVPALSTIIVLAGLMQLAAGALKLGQWFRAVSPAVVRGMMAGIGIAIFAAQFHLMLDDDRPPAGTLAQLASIPEAIWNGVLPLDGSRHHQAAAVGMLTIFVIVAWKELPWKRVQMLPGVLVGVLAAVLLANSLHWPITFVELSDGLRDDVRLLSPSAAYSWLNKPDIWLGAVTVALIASAETLLSASAVDKMHHGPRTRYDRELAAQGVGNLVCGLLGALPMTGVIVRSSANVDAGARTRLSTILHGCWLLVIVSLFPHVLELIPRCALAAVLVYSGYKLIDLAAIRELWALGKGEVAIYAVTVAGIVVEGLLLGVLVGVILAAARLFYLISNLHVRVRVNSLDCDVRLQLRGVATFLRLPKLASALDRIPPGSSVRIDVEGLIFIDHACHDLLVTWCAQHEKSGGKVQLDWTALDHHLRRATPRPERVSLEEQEAV